MCLNSSNVVEPMIRSSPAASTGLISVARSIVPPVVAPAPTVVCTSSMNRIGVGRRASASITALNRSSKSPRYRVPASNAAVSSANTSARSQLRRHVVVVEQPARQPLGHGRSCRHRHRRRTPGCSCDAGRESRSCAAAPRCVRSAGQAGRAVARSVRLTANAVSGSRDGVGPSRPGARVGRFGRGCHRPPRSVSSRCRARCNSGRRAV